MKAEPLLGFGVGGQNQRAFSPICGQTVIPVISTFDAPVAVPFADMVNTLAALVAAEVFSPATVRPCSVAYSP